MKKILALILMAGVTQGLVSQEQPNEYKYLKQLPDNSRIKRICYPVVASGWFWTHKNICDDLEKSFELDTIVETDKMFSRFSNQELREMISEKSWPETRDQAIQNAKEKMVCKSFRILRTLSKMNERDRTNEGQAMANLAGKVCEESLDQFEQAVRDRSTR